MNVLEPKYLNILHPVEPVKDESLNTTVNNLFNLLSGRNFKCPSNYRAVFPIHNGTLKSVVGSGADWIFLYWFRIDTKHMTEP